MSNAIKPLGLEPFQFPTKIGTLSLLGNILSKTGKYGLIQLLWRDEYVKARRSGNGWRTARKDEGLTLQELAESTGVSKSSIARFESDRAVPGFGDVFVIARQLGWPLLYFATGKQRSGDDDRTLVTHLQSWGLRDVKIPEPILTGEARPFEELLAKVVSRPITQRILAALPGLLLRNDFDPNRLLT